MPTNNTAAGAISSMTPQFLHFNVCGGVVPFYWKMKWTEYGDAAYPAGVIFSAKQGKGMGWGAFQLIPSSAGSGATFQGMEFGQSTGGGGSSTSCTVLNQYWQYKIDSAQMRAVLTAVKAANNGELPEAGEEFALGKVELTAYQDVGFSIKVDTTAFGIPNPSSAEIFFYMPELGNLASIQLQICNDMDQKLLDNKDKCSLVATKQGSCALKDHWNWTLADVDFGALGVDMTGGKGPCDFVDKLAIQYHGHTDSLWINGIELDNYHPCYVMTACDDINPSDGDQSFSSAELYAAGVCTGGRTGGCCDDPSVVDGCEPENRALFDAIAMKWCVTNGFDPRSLSSDGMGCMIEAKDISGRQVDGKYIWKRYNMYGRREGARTHGISNSIVDEKSADSITSINNDLSATETNFRSYITAKQDVIYVGQETWRQGITVMTPDATNKAEMQNEANRFAGGFVLPNDATLSKYTLEKVIIQAQKMGIGIDGDNFSFDMTMSSTRRTAVDSESHSTTFSAALRYDNLLTDAMYPDGGGFLQKDSVQASLSHSVNGNLVYDAYTDKDGNYIVDKDVTTGSISEIDQMTISHTMYFINEWQVEYGGSYGRTTTSTVNGTSTTFHKYLGMKVKKKFFEDKLLFTAAYDANGKHSMGIYINASKFSRRVGKAKFTPSAGAVFKDGGFHPTLGCKILWGKALNLSYNALTGDAKLMFHKGITFAKESEDGTGRDLTMNLFGSHDLTGTGGSAVGFDVKYNDCVINMQKLKSKIYFKARANALFSLGVPGSGMMDSQGISFHAGAAVAAVYKADWFRFLDIPLIIGFGPAAGFSLSSYQDASGLGGQGMGGTGWDMVMGPWYISFEIIDQYAHEMEIRHHSVFHNVPILGFLTGLVPVLSTLGRTEDTKEYIGRVAGTRTAFIMIECKKVYDKKMKKKLNAIKKDTGIWVQSTNYKDYNQSGPCDKRIIKYEKIYEDQHAWMKANRFCDSLNVCFAGARLQSTTAGMSVYKKISEGANWKHQADWKDWGRFRDRTENVSEMLQFEQNCFDTLRDAKDWTAVENKAREVSGSLFNQIVNRLNPAKLGVGAAKGLKKMFGWFKAALKAAATVTAGVLPFNKMWSCPDTKQISDATRKANVKTLEGYMTMANCSGGEEFVDCWKFLEQLERARVQFAWLTQIYREMKGFLEEMGVIDNVFEDNATIATKFRARCLDENYEGISQAMFEDFDKRWITGSTFDNMTAKEAAAAVVNFFNITPISSFCGTPPTNIWDAWDMNDGNVYDCVQELWAWANQFCPIHSCVDSTGQSNPCLAYDSWMIDIYKFSPWIDRFYDMILKAMNNPVEGGMIWDGAAKNYGNNSWTSMSQMQNEAKAVKDCICQINSGGQSANDCFVLLQAYNTKNTNFVKGSPGYRGESPENKGKIDTARNAGAHFFKSLRYEQIRTYLTTGRGSAFPWLSDDSYTGIENEFYEDNRKLDIHEQGKCQVALSTLWAGNSDPANIGYLSVPYLAKYPPGTAIAGEYALAGSFTLSRTRAGQPPSASSMGIPELQDVDIKTWTPTDGDKETCFYCDTGLQPSP